MDRERLLDWMTRELMSGRAFDGPVVLTDRVDRSDQAITLAAWSLVLALKGRGDEAAQLASEALRGSRDTESLTLARAAAGISLSLFETAHDDPDLLAEGSTGDVLSDSLEAADSLTGAAREVIVTLLVEAALGCARVELATTLVSLIPTAPDELFGDPRHPYLTFSRVLRARVSAFHADLPAALEWSARSVDGATTTVERLFARACLALVSGNGGSPDETRTLVAEIESGELLPVDAVTRGCLVLASYGAVAIGDLDASARLILSAGGGPGLEALRIIDRALGLELLVALAVTGDDLTAAEAWLDRALPLVDHPIADSTVARARSRVALLAGDVESAVALARWAVDTARRHGRAIEAAEGEITLARAQVADNRRGDAARALAETAERAQRTGHAAAIRAVRRELRHLGRRLPPRGNSGWAGLSPRERDVALLLITGLSNAEIAAELYLSEHTVRAHVSRVLHACGVATRAGVVRTLGPRITPPRPAPPLTPRQRQVAAMVADGMTNRAIAATLGIGVTTVEKHISHILRQWNVSSRAGITAVALSSPEHSDDRPPARTA